MGLASKFASRLVRIRPQITRLQQGVYCG